MNDFNVNQSQAGGMSLGRAAMAQQSQLGNNLVATAKMPPLADAMARLERQHETLLNTIEKLEKMLVGVLRASTSENGLAAGTVPPQEPRSPVVSQIHALSERMGNTVNYVGSLISRLDT